MDVGKDTGYRRSDWWGVKETGEVAEGMAMKSLTNLAE